MRSPLCIWLRSERGGGGYRLTDEVGVIRREFVVQLDGVRLVDGVPERGSASNNRVDVFRAGGSGRNTRDRRSSQSVACWRGGALTADAFLAVGTNERGRTGVSQSAG